MVFESLLHLQDLYFQTIPYVFLETLDCLLSKTGGCSSLHCLWQVTCQSQSSSSLHTIATFHCKQGNGLPSTVSQICFNSPPLRTIWKVQPSLTNSLGEGCDKGITICKTVAFLPLKNLLVQKANQHIVLKVKGNC